MISSQQGSANFEDRVVYMRELSDSVSESQRRAFEEKHLMSWVYHDSALEGVVYTFQELKVALDPAAGVTDSSLQPVVEEIRRH